MIDISIEEFEELKLVQTRKQTGMITFAVSAIVGVTEEGVSESIYMDNIEVARMTNGLCYKIEEAE